MLPPQDDFFQLPEAYSVKFESSLFNVRCLFIFGSCQLITKDCCSSSSSSFNTELHRMYPVQVLREAACCCTIHQRLLPPLYCYAALFWRNFREKKLCCDAFCCLIANCVLCCSLGRKQNYKTQKSRIFTRAVCSSSLVPFWLESDLWNYTDIGSGFWGGLSAGSAGPEDQTAPEPPSGNGSRSHWDKV